MKAIKVWFADDRIFIETDTGEELSQSLNWYPRLMAATTAQRKAYRLSEMGIHWAELDEDVSYESFEYGEDEGVGGNEIADIFGRFPEINVSKLAGRVGAPRSVLAAYLCGAKKPSKKRKQEIITALHELGTELSTI